MKYFMVTAKCGHVGKNNYYKGTLFFKANNGKEAARLARECPRVKHDQKNAILSVSEIDGFIFEVGRELNHSIHYYTCETVQEQRKYLSEIEDVHSFYRNGVSVEIIAKSLNMTVEQVNEILKEPVSEQC